MSLALESLGLVALGIGTALVVRGYRLRRTGGPARLGWATLGVVSIAAVVGGPVHSWAEHALAGHMTQHVVLLLAPLALVLGRTGTTMMLGLPVRARRAISRRLRTSAPLRWWRAAARRPVAMVLLLLVVGAWHVPPVFDAAAASEPLHAAEHLSLLAVGGWYWMSILGGSPRREQGSALLSIFGVMLGGTAFGALLTFATEPWYPRHARLATAAGLDWLRDQQAAGLVMWIPPSIVLLAVFVRVAASWLERVDRRARRIEVAS